MLVEHSELFNDLKVVLCHDWLVTMRGGERVLALLCELFPKSPIMTLFYDSSGISSVIKSHEIRASWLQRIPRIKSNYRFFLPLFPYAIGSLKVPSADIIISTSHCVAKAIQTPQGRRHLCYCFTPMRYAWGFHEAYFGKSGVKAFIGRIIMHRLRLWDRKTCDRVHRFVAISKNVQQRILQCYGRDADVVYPPVDTHFFTPAVNSASCGDYSVGQYDLIVSALVPYKRIDLAVKAYTKMRLPLVVVGSGSEFKKVKQYAGSNIKFTGWISNEELLKLYRGCRMLIFPGEEDFGLVPLEAQACGKPVVAFARGGVLESVVEGVTGVFFREQTVSSLIEAIKICSGKKWDPHIIRANAERFNIDTFIQGIRKSICRCMERPVSTE